MHNIHFSLLILLHICGIFPIQRHLRLLKKSSINPLTDFKSSQFSICFIDIVFNILYYFFESSLLFELNTSSGYERLSLIFWMVLSYFEAIIGTIL